MIIAQNAGMMKKGRYQMAKRILKSESKRKYDSEDSRRRLLRAAIDVFSSAGYDAATTRKIAKKSGGE